MLRIYVASWQSMAKEGKGVLTNRWRHQMIPISTNQGHLMCPVTKMNNSCLMITQGSMASMVKFAEFRYFRCRLQ